MTQGKEDESQLLDWELLCVIPSCFGDGLGEDSLALPSKVTRWACIRAQNQSCLSSWLSHCSAGERRPSWGLPALLCHPHPRGSFAILTSSGLPPLFCHPYPWGSTPPLPSSHPQGSFAILILRDPPLLCHPHFRGCCCTFQAPHPTPGLSQCLWHSLQPCSREKCPRGVVLG